MKKPLLVTLANKKYLEYAKQVFAGAYFNAGWQGDYMLLAHDIPEKNLAWFRKKGILVKHCKPLYQGVVANQPAVYVSRFYVFQKKFKKWSHVLYFDADTVIKKPLNHLLKIQGFGAVRNYFDYVGLNNQIIHPDLKEKQVSLKTYVDLKADLAYKCDLKKTNFCASFFILNTNIITENTFDDILDCFNKYKAIALMADESTLNFFFCNQWQELSPLNNFYIYNSKNHWRISLKEIRKNVISIHNMGQPKPWESNSVFHKEWKRNYILANKIDLNKIPVKKNINDEGLRRYSRFLKQREIFWQYDKFLWLLEQTYYYFLKSFEKHWPSLFKRLKQLKADYKQNSND